MLVIFNKRTNEISLPTETTFTANQILERQHIEKWIENHPGILGEELLILTTEYDQFDKTNERLDLLALDTTGMLVIVELKRDDSGKDVHIQAIKYAAYCSTLTFDDVVSIHTAYLAKKGLAKSTEEVRGLILSFIKNSEFSQISDRPRIIIVSNNYRPEVTASVLWLRKFGIDIKCIRLIPYEIDKDTLGFESTTIIPLPEAEEFIIKAEQKDNSNRTLSVPQQEYIKFFSELIELVSQNLDVEFSNPLPRNYYPIRVDVPGVHFEWIFHGRPRNAFGVELHFERSRLELNKPLLDCVVKYKEFLEKEVGQKLIIEEVWYEKWCRAYFQLDSGEINDNLKDWAVRTTLKFYQLFYEKIYPEMTS